MELPVTWTLHNSGGFVLVGRCAGLELSHDNTALREDLKVAAIDLNKTLIMSKSGTLHGNDETDWRWWDDSIPAKLQALALKKYTIIITSNQGRLTEFDGSEAPEAAPFKRKMEFIMRDLKIPVTLLVACANDIYRKPRPGLWSIIPKVTGNEGCVIDKAQSFVVGDAAGRENDFSDSDVHWAMNAGVPFYTPEVFFLGKDPEPLGHKFHPEWYLNTNKEEEDLVNMVHFSSLSMIILIGLPGAGKSTFYRRVLQDRGFTRRDARSYDSRESFVHAVDEAMTQGIPVVIDDLNIDIESRTTWISMAAKHGISADAFCFMSPTNLCLHNDTVRALGGPLMNLENRLVYPRLHFLDLLPRFQKPTTCEGFRAVHEINFRWSGTEEERDIWRRFWL
ncbi:PNK3P-domain-containing protein [Annulohypoxylon maeteangense]|uniref:PNK3P-domain-containing protein n=1 Tax=Annulohypoxylon maeteangense TaxID=1927788 RepID=UPI002008BF03|nr:PNK3P-domain-containing protein [Annulohypoxylon maeteangense]KAI0886601.1 PNK3P-domain-containing protein [Annulohypoxylon maeteangense]